MDSATPSDPNTEKVIEIATVGTVVSAENEESSLPKPNEITAEVSLASDEVKQASSSATTAVKKETEGKASSLAPEVSKESDATTSSHEEEVILYCVNLFDLVHIFIVLLMLPKK